MTSKRTLILVAISVVIAALLGVFFTDGILWNSGKRITKENFDRIELGMTFEQVEDVFGCLPLGKRLTEDPNDGEANWSGVWDGLPTGGTGVQTLLEFSVEDVLVDMHWHVIHRR